MNKIKETIIALGVCTTLIAGSMGVTIAHAKEHAYEAAQKNQETVSLEATQEIRKDETVYVIAGADGTVQKIIVSDWIKNATGSESLEDSSELTGIENVKGDESYVVNGENMKIWDTKGQDIYYQGNIEKELPVTLKVTYMLDGKVVSADEIAGKSGKVTIRFDYINNQYQMVEIDGKEEKINVPFAMLTGMLLDNEVFKNVEVSNGKLINDGDHTIVAGIAFPGLWDNLAIESDKIEIPDYVEITADVTDFEFGMTVTVATNEIFNHFDTTKFDSIDDLKAAIGELTDGMNKLLDGSSALYDGLATLLEKFDELVEGINTLAEGANALQQGAAALENGTEQLQTGSGALLDGLNTLASNNATLNAGAKQVFESLLATATEQLNASGLDVPELTMTGYAAVLDSVIASLDETVVYNSALAMVQAAVEEKRPLIEAMVTEAVREQVKAAVTEAVKAQVSAQVIGTATGMSVEQYTAAVEAGMIPEANKNAIDAAIEAQIATEAVQTTIDATTDAKMQTEEIKASILENVEKEVKQAVEDNMASETVQTKLVAAKAGVIKITALRQSLDNYKTFYEGLLAYTTGVGDAAAGAAAVSQGAADLYEGAVKLNEGAAALYEGILKVQNGVVAMQDGVSQLKDGSMQLSEGLQKFNDEGIAKLTELVEDNLSEVVTRLKATMDVSREYKNFAGIADDMDGQVKFIYRTDEIVKQ